MITVLSAIRFLVLFCLLMVLDEDFNTAFAGDTVNSGQPSTLSTQDLGEWVKSVLIPGSSLQDIVLEKQFLLNETIHPFSKQQLVGLSVSGSVQLRSEQSLVRILLIDDQLNEYLAYEVYPLIAPASSFQIRDVCRETCVLPAIVPSALRVELIDASLEIQTVVVNQMTIEGAAGTASIAQSRQLTEKVKNAQETEIIELLNRQIKAKGLRWIAGETAISRLSYAEKKRLFGRDTLPNLQGFEYYKGGIFEVNPGNTTPSSPGSDASSLINSFDWRNRHGANKPESPYYDGDSTGSGWITSVKSQLCADCWAHSALGATEAQVNLYFNQHLDLDLSEQELVSCSGAGSCQYGGNPGAALSYISNVGVVDETCFPESGTDEACNLCPVPQERIQIAGYEGIDPYAGEDNIKRRLISFGPLPFGISSWWHCMVLVGYERDTDTGETVWILKNSWGTSWGENGYGYLKVSLNDIYLTYNLRSPVISLITPYEITCRDADGDGYYNWGFSEEPPASCKNVSSVKDCDDSDSNVALLKDDGGCVAPAVSVSIDIKPGSFPNSINPRSKGVIPVAILTDTFDATTVDALSVEFGPARATESHGRGHIEDVDGDGDQDLVLHFRTQDTGIQCGETSASLTGMTTSGTAIQGSDSIRTLKWCRHRCEHQCAHRCMQ